jgi:hypothetical protein
LPTKKVLSRRNLSDAEDPEFAILPGPVLLQQEGEKHQESAIVNDPPNVNRAFHLVRNSKFKDPAFTHKKTFIVFYPISETMMFVR